MMRLSVSLGIARKQYERSTLVVLHNWGRARGKCGYHLRFAATTLVIPSLNSVTETSILRELRIPTHYSSKSARRGN